MRIGLLSGAYPPSVDGIGDYTHLLARELSRQHEVSVFTGRQDAYTQGDRVSVAGIFDPTQPAGILNLPAAIAAKPTSPAKRQRSSVCGSGRFPSFFSSVVRPLRSTPPVADGFPRSVSQQDGRRSICPWARTSTALALRATKRGSGSGSGTARSFWESSGPPTAAGFWAGLPKRRAGWPRTRRKPSCFTSARTGKRCARCSTGESGSWIADCFPARLSAIL